jgi:hypothetical protein
MTSELVLPAELFSDEPVERVVEYPNGYQLKVLLMPIKAEWDVEYQKRKGHDLQTLKFKPRKDEDGAGASFEFEPIERIFSNEREVAANQWLAGKVVRGFPDGLKLSDGKRLEDPMKHLKELAAIPWLIHPILRAAFDLVMVKTEIEEGN